MALARSTIKPEPCADPDCDGRHLPAERIALAASLCSARGARLTAQRRRILEMLWSNGRPTGAYELVDAMKRRDSRPIGPPTVYRALQFLISQGLVSKLESRNAFVPCTHPERQNACLFFICSACGASLEVEDRRLENRISEHAAHVGFQATRRMIEVEGLCARCHASCAT